jgi:hypothetical protein
VFQFDLAVSNTSGVEVRELIGNERHFGGWGAPHWQRMNKEIMETTVRMKIGEWIKAGVFKKRMTGIVRKNIH